MGKVKIETFGPDYDDIRFKMAIQITPSKKIRISVVSNIEGIRIKNENFLGLGQTEWVGSIVRGFLGDKRNYNKFEEKIIEYKRHMDGRMRTSAFNSRVSQTIREFRENLKSQMNMPEASDNNILGFGQINEGVTLW